MQTEQDILRSIRTEEIKFPPLRIEVAEVEVPVNDSTRRFLLDALLNVYWRSQVFKFGAEITTRYTPQAIEQAIVATIRYNKQYSSRHCTHPMIIVPYLSESALNRLEEQSVSGVDLCGNGIITVPGQLLVLRTGFPNKYPSSEPIKNVYRGNSSLVARAFFARGIHSSVNDLYFYIRQRGGTLALSTVSKALSVLEADLIVGRESGSIRLLQPEKLLEKLVANYQSPKVSRKLQARYLKGPDSVMEALVSNAEANHARYVLTGTSSTNLYGTVLSSDSISLYCTNIDDLLSLRNGENPAPVEETTRFHRIELVETKEETVYFDKRTNNLHYDMYSFAEILLYGAASPVQTYLELMAGGPREKQTADALRHIILNESRKAHHESV